MTGLDTKLNANGWSDPLSRQVWRMCVLNIASLHVSVMASSLNFHPT